MEHPTSSHGISSLPNSSTSSSSTISGSAARSPSNSVLGSAVMLRISAFFSIRGVVSSNTAIMGNTYSPIPARSREPDRATSSVMIVQRQHRSRPCQDEPDNGGLPEAPAEPGEKQADYTVPLSLAQIRAIQRGPGRSGGDQRDAAQKEAQIQQNDIRKSRQPPHDRSVRVK